MVPAEALGQVLPLHLLTRDARPAAGAAFQSTIRISFELAWDVSSAVQYACDGNPPLGGPIKDQVTPHRKASQLGSQVLAPPPHLRVLGEEVAFLLDEVQKTVCRVGTVVRDARPDLEEVELGEARPQHAG